MQFLSATTGAALSAKWSLFMGTAKRAPRGSTEDPVREQLQMTARVGVMDTAGLTALSRMPLLQRWLCLCPASHPTGPSQPSCKAPALSPPATAPTLGTAHVQSSSPTHKPTQLQPDCWCFSKRPHLETAPLSPIIPLLQPHVLM